MKKLKIALTGRSGFIGSQLCIYLQKVMHAEIVSINRSLLYGSSEDLARTVDGCNVLIHLAGASIMCRWTKKKKDILWSSRVITTHNLVEALSLLENPPHTFISTSAAGIFDTSHEHDEYSENYNDHFLGQLCRKWEDEAMRASDLGVRTIIFRLGVVLGNQGGALKQLLPIFKIGLGGELGSGDQPFPYIHIDDLLSAYVYVLNNSSCVGVYHLVTPEIISNKTFTRVLGKILRRPTWFTVPTWVLKLLYGQGAQLLFMGQKLIPSRLIKSGFGFRYPSIKEALANILS